MRWRLFMRQDVHVLGLALRTWTALSFFPPTVPRVNCTCPQMSPAALMIGSAVNCRLSSSPVISARFAPFSAHVLAFIGKNRTPVSFMLNTKHGRSPYVATNQTKRSTCKCAVRAKSAGRCRAARVPLRRDRPIRPANRRDQEVDGFHVTPPDPKTPKVEARMSGVVRGVLDSRRYYAG